MGRPRDQLISDRFKVLEEVAAGGQGRIYKAVDEQSGQMVALKRLTLTDLDSHQRFEREATLLASVDHPNVVGYVTHGRSNAESFLVMQWVDGESLYSRMNKIGLEVSESVRLGIEICGALGALHALGLVHRDVKPANIMVPHGASSPATLVDFGLVKNLEPSSLTRTGLTVGSPSYMSPEQARGTRLVTPASDVYAMACVLYFTLTGSKAFPGSDTAAVEAKILALQPPPPHQANPEVPEALSTLVMGALSVDPTRRPVNGTDFANQLSKLAPVGTGRRVLTVGPLKPGADPTSSVVSSNHALCHFAVAISPVESDDGLPIPPTPSATAQMEHLAATYQCSVSRLHDGTAVVIPLGGGRTSPTKAAQCALALIHSVPGRAAVLAVDAHSADGAIDRAMRLISAEQTRLDVSGPQPLRLRIESLAAQALSEAFVVEAQAGLVFLIEEKPTTRRRP